MRACVQVVEVWSSEIVGGSRVLAAFQQFVHTRQAKRLYNQVTRTYIHGESARESVSEKDREQSERGRVSERCMCITRSLYTYMS